MATSPERQDSTNETSTLVASRSTLDPMWMHTHGIKADLPRVQVRTRSAEWTHIHPAPLVQSVFELCVTEWRVGGNVPSHPCHCSGRICMRDDLSRVSYVLHVQVSLRDVNYDVEIPGGFAFWRWVLGSPTPVVLAPVLSRHRVAVCPRSFSIPWRDHEHCEVVGTCAEVARKRRCLFARGMVEHQRHAFVSALSTDPVCRARFRVWLLAAQARIVTRFVHKSTKTLHVLSKLNADFRPGSMTLVRLVVARPRAEKWFAWPCAERKFSSAPRCHAAAGPWRARLRQIDAVESH
jgi:hypothetical protein